jgi:hypothetical protein
VQSGFPSSLGRPSEDLLSPPTIADVTSDGSSTSETSLPYNALQTGPPHGLGMSSQPAPAAGDPNTLPPVSHGQASLALEAYADLLRFIVAHSLHHTIPSAWKGSPSRLPISETHVGWTVSANCQIAVMSC